MRLLNAAIHKHGAAAAQIHRHIGKKADLRKFFGTVAQDFRKGLQKAATATGAGFVQKDIIDGAIMDFEAFHILSADVEDKIHIGLQMMRSIKMSHGFYDAVVHAEGMANQVLAVAGHSAC